MMKLALAAALLLVLSSGAFAQAPEKIHLSQSRKPLSPNHQHHLRPLSLSRQRLKPLSL